MQSFRASALCGAAVAAVALTWSGPGSAAERGDFGQYLSGNNIGAAIAAPAPPGLYFVLDTFYGPHGEGFGQNNSAPLPGQKVSAFLYAPTLFWSTGVTLLGGKLSMALVQPFLNVASYTNTAASAGPPINGVTGQSAWLDSIENTQITPLILDWNLGKGWFGGVGMTFVVPDGSRYNGTANSDYFSFQPRAFLAYLDRDWHLTANFRYNINTASAGHTGFYQSEAASVAATPLAAFAPTVASIGNGYRSGDTAFLDAAALYQYKKWEFGPVASLKFQTTSDTPGSGFTCAQLQAGLPTPIPGLKIPVPVCGKSESVAVGGLIGVDLGAAHFQMWATDSVHTQDDFGGWGVYSRLIFKLTDDAPAARPLITK
jgi:Putative MetA-pathway of phenol degradation